MFMILFWRHSRTADRKSDADENSVTLKKSVVYDGRNCQVSVNSHPGSVFMNFCVNLILQTWWICLIIFELKFVLIKYVTSVFYLIFPLYLSVRYASIHREYSVRYLWCMFTRCCTGALLLTKSLKLFLMHLSHEMHTSSSSTLIPNKTYQIHEPSPNQVIFL